MATIPWTTGYPTTVDTETEMPDLTDGADVVIVSHPLSLRDSVIALEQENTGYKDNTAIGAGSNVTVDVLDAEFVVGTAVLNGGNVYHLIPSMRMIGTYVVEGSTLDAELRLYDMGSIATPLAPPVLRATAVLVIADDSNLVVTQVPLTVSASPGVDADQVQNTARIYEFRIFVPDDSQPAYVTCSWVGFALGVTQV